MFEKIIIGYWDGVKIEDTPWERNEEIEYSTDMLNTIVHYTLGKGYNIMTQRTKDALIVWISKGRFIQQ